jgi:hypothetical protein
MNESIRKVLESKRAARQRLSLLSFTEKIQLLEKLRDRSLAIRQSSKNRRD